METLITKAELKTRNWTETLIQDYFPIPTQTLSNPKNIKNKIKLYNFEKVLNIENTNKFIFDYYNTANIKNPILSTKTAIDEYVSKVDIIVPVMEEKELIELAINHYTLEYNLKSIKPNLINKITKNYLIYQLMKFEKVNVDIFDRVGNFEANRLILEKLNNNIKLIYPTLN